MSTDREEQESSFKNQKAYYEKYISEKPDYELAGIYADEGISATNTKKREQFKQMISDCEAGKIDLVITKSISRFARNTQDCLQYSRQLKDLQIPIIFEKEGINTMEASGELLFTILSSLAQEESRNISENCKWAIRHNFQNGKPSINTTLFMGYDMGEDGKLVINEKQAKIVRRVFHLFEEGYTPSYIGRILREDGVKGVKSKSWASSVIQAMLKNEKYAGDILMQKTYTPDFLTKKKYINHGEVDQYFMENCHEAIIPKDEWLAVQLEIERRDAYREEINGAVYHNSKGTNPYSQHVLCGHCGSVYRRKTWSRNGRYFWMCGTKQDTRLAECQAENVLETSIDKAFQIAWNSIVAQAEELTPKWDRMIEEGNPLERLRAKQMKLLVTEGPVHERIYELVIMVLERMIIYDKRTFEVRFLDGSTKKVVLPEE